MVARSMLPVALLAVVGLTGTARASIEGAIPAGATDALFVARIDRDLPLALDAFERAFGSEEASLWVEDAPFPALALQILVGVRKEVIGIDPEGGLGLYRTPTFYGAVGVVAVIDANKAEESLADWFAQLGAEPGRDRTGAVVVRLPDGGELRSIARGGHLYLTIPETEAPFSFGDDVRHHLRPSDDPADALPEEGQSLLTDPLYRELREGTKAGNTYLFLRRPFEEDLDLDGLLLSFEIGQDAVKVDGRIAAPGHGWARPAPKAAPARLDRIGDGAALIASSRIAPAGLASLIAGPPASERRRRFTELLTELQLPAEATLAALSGDLAVAFHVNPAALDFGAPDAPAGWFDLEFGLSGAHGLAAKLGAMRIGDVRVWSRAAATGALERRVTLDGDPLKLRVDRERLRAHYGIPENPRARPGLVSRLQREFGPNAFGEGHLTVLIDLRTLPSGPSPFADLLGMERIFVDVWSEGTHLHVAGEVRFVPLALRARTRPPLHPPDKNTPSTD